MDSKPNIEPAGRSSTERLRDALAAMVRQQADGGSPEALTATTLCQIAGISRNALCRYHPEMPQALHEAQRRQCREPGSAKRALRQLHQENDALREQVTKLAALVDHYFAVSQEGRLRLERCARELAGVRRRNKPQVISLRQ